MADIKQFAEQLVNLTVKEVNELAEILKNYRTKFNESEQEINITTKHNKLIID